MVYLQWEQRLDSDCKRWLRIPMTYCREEMITQCTHHRGPAGLLGTRDMVSDQTPENCVQSEGSYLYQQNLKVISVIRVCVGGRGCPNGKCCHLLLEVTENWILSFLAVGNSCPRMPCHTNTDERDDWPQFFVLLHFSFSWCARVCGRLWTKALRCRNDQEDMLPTFMVFLMEFLKWWVWLPHNRLFLNQKSFFPSIPTFLLISQPSIRVLLCTARHVLWLSVRG